MDEKYGEIKIMNQDEYREYYTGRKYYTGVIRDLPTNIYTYRWHSPPPGSFCDPQSNFRISCEQPGDIILYDPSYPIVYIKSVQLYNIVNTILLDEIKNNNTYIIHVIATDSIIDYDGKANIRNILFIDNCCNYYEIGSPPGYDYYGYYKNHNNISNIPLSNSNIDSIKIMKDILPYVYNSHDKANNPIYKYLDLVKQSNQDKFNLNAQSSQIQDLQSKLDEQTKLNETLCKRLFELKN